MVRLCGACQALGKCRLGLEEEALAAPGVVTMRLTCASALYEGGPGVSHGGWTAAVMDEMLGHVAMLNGTMTVTATLTTDFLKPVPVDRPLEGRAWVTRREGSRWYNEGELRLASSGALLARAKGIFVERDMSHFERHRAWLAEQGSTPRHPGEGP